MRRTKKTGWEVMICGGCDESDESDSMLRNQFDKFAYDRVAAFTGREGCDVGAGMYSTIIPTPTWRKIGNQRRVARQHSLWTVRWADLGLCQGCQGVNMPWELLVRT